MPEYIYRCKNGHETLISHGMLEAPRTWCPDCGEEMRKKPMAATVLWSRFIEPSPAVKHHLDHLEEYKERNAMKYGN